MGLPGLGHLGGARWPYCRDVRPGRAPSRARDTSGRTVGATLLSTFAVGCPVCNKLVVAVLGVSGALTYWAPTQPLLGVLSVGLLAAGLLIRLGGAVACAAPAGLSA